MQCCWRVTKQSWQRLLFQRQTPSLIQGWNLVEEGQGASWGEGLSGGVLRSDDRHDRSDRRKGRDLVGGLDLYYDGAAQGASHYDHGVVAAVLGGGDDESDHGSVRLRMWLREVPVVSSYPAGIGRVVEEA